MVSRGKLLAKVFSQTGFPGKMLNWRPQEFVICSGHVYFVLRRQNCVVWPLATKFPNDKQMQIFRFLKSLTVSTIVQICSPIFVGNGTGYWCVKFGWPSIKVNVKVDYKPWIVFFVITYSTRQIWWPWKIKLQVFVFSEIMEIWQSYSGNSLLNKQFH